MSIDIRVDARKVLAFFDKFGKDVDKAILDSLDISAAEMQEHARQGHPKAAAGALPDAQRVRTVDGSGEYNGQYRFLTQTGILRNSIKIRKAARVGTVMQAGIFTAVEYGTDVEFGTVTKRAFPFMRPALAAIFPRAQAAMKRAIATASGSRF